jgi:spore photoproduct lyase
LLFHPRRVYFEPRALDYPLGQKLLDVFRGSKTPIHFTTSHNRVTGIPGKGPQKAFYEGKHTLVVGVRKTSKFQTCRPSAHYQLPLVTGCPGLCEYCYLNTTMGKKPYIRIYVNIDEILEWVQQHIRDREPEETVFEGAATSDPVPVEPYTGSLARTIEFFGAQNLGRFRFVTKFDDLDSILSAKHEGKTEVRFSINTAPIIAQFEHGTPSLEKRLAAARRVREAGYPLGFLVAPIMRIDNWKSEYSRMFEEVRRVLGSEPVSFEFITHRFTQRAKSQILSVFPQSALDMDETRRRFKYGQFGYGKYVYPPDTMAELKDFFTAQAYQVSDQAKVLYNV